MKKGSNNKKIYEIEDKLLIICFMVLVSLFIFVLLEPVKYSEYISGFFK
ncbi:hypothetical protein [Lysinibacillus sphaericus]|nr:hypothetical protein [Lysinibacillus sphaericus]